MEIIKYADRITHPAHDNAEVYEYPMHNKTLDICVVHVTGRTPAKGSLINHKSSCICYCISGEGTVCGHTVSQGDTFNIPANTAYWFDGIFEFTLCCTPAYDPNQNELITL